MATNWVLNGTKRIQNWVNWQQYRNNTLLPEHVEKLNKVGFVWNGQEAQISDEQWMEHFHELVKYIRESDISLLPLACEDHPQRSLGLLDRGNRTKTTNFLLSAYKN